MPTRPFTYPPRSSETTDAADGKLSPSLAALFSSWRRSLVAANRSDETVDSYLFACRQLGAYLAESNMPQAVESIRREHIEAYLADLRDRGRKPKTLISRYAALRQFFAWCEEEGEISESPMQHVKPASLDDAPPEMLSEVELRKLLAACSGNDFAARRDSAIIRLFCDTGMRAGALLGIRVDDVNLPACEITVTTKGHGRGKSTYVVPFGTRTAAALDRYLRARAKVKHAQDPQSAIWLWLAKFGRLGYPGLYGILARRATQAGIRPIHPHMFRHTFADMWLDAGGHEDELMHLGNWRDRKVMSRYGRANLAKRARAAHRELSPGDRL